MPKDPLKYAMGVEPDYGVLGDLTGGLMEQAGNIPWLQALGQTAGKALDWADVSGPEYMEAPWYQRAAAGAIDPGGTIAEVGGLAAGVTDPDTLLKMKMMGGFVPDATPGPVSPAVGGVITGGSKPLRHEVAKGLKDIKTMTKTGAPLRKNFLEATRKAKRAPKGEVVGGGLHIANQPTSKTTKDWLERRFGSERGLAGQMRAGRKGEILAAGRPARRAGYEVDLPELEGVSQRINRDVHELVHVANSNARISSPKELAKFEDALLAEGGHPRAQYLKSSNPKARGTTQFNQWIDESIAYTIEDLQRGSLIEINQRPKFQEALLKYMGY